MRAVWGVGGDAPTALPVPRSRFPAGAPAARSVEGEGCFARSLRAAKGGHRAAVGGGGRYLLCCSPPTLPPCQRLPDFTLWLQDGLQPSSFTLGAGEALPRGGGKKTTTTYSEETIFIIFFPKEKKKAI